MGEEEGLKAKKSDFKAWYAEVVKAAELIEHSKVSGCSVFRPWAYFIWERVHEYFDKEIKKLGVDNVYFPMLIPESIIMKEAEHIKGFAPEVAWVTKGGSKEFEEPLAIRPTSETVMYDVFSKWIRSWRDLPLKINQWCNIVRWEFKTPTPFLRTREILWQEGHTVYANKKDAEREVLDILKLYKQVFKDLFAVPAIMGQKTDKEKFAGADYTTSIETVLPDGKTIQAGTSHHLGQGFAKAFDITFLDKDGVVRYPYQNSWGLTTRSIGVAVIAHGDDKGLILPPAIAYYQAVIVPVFNDKTKKAVLKEAKILLKSLKGVRAYVDDSDKSPGWKFNHWELKGVPLRLEIGPRDIKEKQVIIVKRTGGKRSVKRSKLNVKKLLSEVHEELYNNALKVQKLKVKKVLSKDELYKAIREGFVAKSCWCGDEGHEDELKNALGAKSANMPFGAKLFSKKCAFCGKAAKHVVLWSRQY